MRPINARDIRFNNSILCPKCLRIMGGTKHHILPQRFFGGDGAILYLCRHCHEEIERLIPQKEKLSSAEYIQIARNFLSHRGAK